MSIGSFRRKETAENWKQTNFFDVKKGNLINVVFSRIDRDEREDNNWTGIVKKIGPSNDGGRYINMDEGTVFSRENPFVYIEP